MKITRFKKHILIVGLIISVNSFCLLVFAQESSDDALLSRPKMEYSSQQQRDPFLSYLVKENPKTQPTQVLVPVKPKLNLNQFKVTGIIWGVSLPQAIINDQVLTVGDLIAGAEILSIEKDGIALSYDGQLYNLAAPGQSLVMLPENVAE